MHSPNKEGQTLICTRHMRISEGLRILIGKQ